MGSDNGETTRWRRKFLRRRRWCKPLPLSLFLLLTVVSLHFSGLVTRRIPMYLQDSPPSATSAIRKTAMSLWASHYLKGRRTTKSRQRRNNSTTLTIVVTGDVHGHHQARRLSALLKKLRRQHNASENEFLVLLDAGDATFPGNETLVANIMNRLGYHAMVVGNHEFDIGSERLDKFRELVHFPVLASNVDGFPSFVKLPLGGGGVSSSTTTLCVMGVTANEPNPLYHYKRSISDELTSILVVWNRIASQCSRSVLLSHGGIILDQKLLRRLSNVDVLIGGHSHVLIPTPTELFQPEYGVPVSLEVGEQYPKLLHTGANGRYIGLVRMEWDPSYSTRIKYHDDDSVNIQTEVLPLEVIAEPDPDWQETEEPTSHPQGKRVRFTVPDSTGLVCSHSCRPGDCLLGNVVTDAMKYCLEHGPCRGGNESWSGIALLESGTLRDCLHPTHYDFSHVLPWPNQLVVLQLRGSTIRKMIEHGLKSTLPPHTSGAFLQVSGIEYQYYSDRVHEIKYNHNRNAVLLYTTSPLTGLDNIDDVPRFVFEKRSTEFPICKKLADKKLRDNDGDKRMHWAVVTDWLASGGDGFGPFVAEAETVLFTNVSMHDAIWNYASARRELTYHLNHRSYYPCCPQFVDSIFPFLRWFGYNHACTY